MQDDLIERLRAEVVVSEDPPTKLIIDGQEVVCAGSKTTMRRNPDGPEAADRIAALAAQLVEARAENERLRLALSTIQEGSRLAGTLFGARMLEKKDRLTWWAVNVLQDAIEASRGTARAALEQGEVK